MVDFGDGPVAGRPQGNQEGADTLSGGSRLFIALQD